jgi:predicted transcriptional regulator
MGNIPLEIEPFKYKHSCAILYLLNQKEKMNLSELAEGIGVKHRTGINRSIEALSESGLITYEDVQPRTKWVKLTKRGYIVAQCMYDMIKAVNVTN